MVIEGIAKLSGGIWALKERCRTSRSRVVRWLSNVVYAKALQAKGACSGPNAPGTLAPAQTGPAHMTVPGPKLDLGPNGPCAQTCPESKLVLSPSRL